MFNSTDLPLFEKVKNRIECINRVHEYINKTAPLLAADFKENGYTTKAGSTELYKKDYERLTALTQKDKGKLHVWLKVSPYSGLQLCVKDNYQVSQSSVNYYEKACFIEREGGIELMPLYSVNDMAGEDLKAARMLEEAQALESKARAIHYITRGR